MRLLPEDKLTRVISAKLGGEVLRTDALLLSDLVSQVLKAKSSSEEQALSEGATFMALWDTYGFAGCAAWMLRISGDHLGLAHWPEGEYHEARYSLGSDGVISINTEVMQ